MPETPIIRSRAGAQRAGAPAAVTLPALRVKYFKRMRPNRVYPVQVGWKGSRKGGEGGAPVQVRLIMAGAQVVPAEQSLDPGEPAAKVTFYVTPLAKGPLRGERAEVLMNGRKVGEVRTPAKVKTQRMTWVLLALTLLVPWLLLQFWATKLRLEVTKPVKANQGEQTRIDDLNKKKTDKTITQAEEQALKNLEEKTTGSTKEVIEHGKVLEHNLREMSPEIFPQVEQYAGKDVAAKFTDIPGTIGDYYTIAFIDYGPDKKFYIPMWTFWGLLLLTLLSYLWHREIRKTRVGQPIEIGE